MEARDRVARRRLLVAWAIAHGGLGLLIIWPYTGIQLFAAMALHAAAGIALLAWATRRLEVELTPRDPRRTG